MEENYVSYQDSRRLKDLGFPQTTSDYRYATSTISGGCWSCVEGKRYPAIYGEDLGVEGQETIAAPSLWLAASWIREEKGIIISVSHVKGTTHWQLELEDGLISSSLFDTPEAAMKIGISKALDILWDLRTLKEAFPEDLLTPEQQKEVRAEKDKTQAIIKIKGFLHGSLKEAKTYYDIWIHEKSKKS